MEKYGGFRTMCVFVLPDYRYRNAHGDLIDRDKLLYYDYPLDNLYQVELADAVIPEEE